MKAINKARVAGWLQLAVVYLNELLNGKAIPTNKQQWIALGSSALVALGLHIGSSTSAGHPDGKDTADSSASLRNDKSTAGFAHGPAIIVLLLLAVLTLALVGCSPLEKQAYRTIVAAKAYVDTEAKQHPECFASSTACLAFKHAIAAKDLLIDATEVYCGGPQFDAGGVCTPPSAKDKLTAARHKLTAAIKGYNQAETDAKAAFTK